MMVGSTRKIQSCTSAGFKKEFFQSRAKQSSLLAKGTEHLHFPAPPSTGNASCAPHRVKDSQEHPEKQFKDNKNNLFLYTRNTSFTSPFSLFCRYHSGPFIFFFQSTGASLLAGACTRLALRFFCWGLEFLQPPAERAGPAHPAAGSPVQP